MFCVRHTFSEWDELIHLKPVQSVVKTLTMTDSKNCNYLPKGVTVRVWHSLMSHHEWKSCSNLHICCPICPKIHMFDRASTLNACKWQLGEFHRATFWSKEHDYSHYYGYLMYLVFCQCFIRSAWDSYRSYWKKLFWCTIQSFVDFVDVQQCLCYSLSNRK